MFRSYSVGIHVWTQPRQTAATRSYLAVHPSGVTADTPDTEHVSDPDHVCHVHTHHGKGGQFAQSGYNCWIQGTKSTVDTVQIGYVIWKWIICIIVVVLLNALEEKLFDQILSPILKQSLLKWHTLFFFQSLVVVKCHIYCTLQLKLEAK